MPQRAVKFPNGEFGVFSTVVDDFVEIGMSEADVWEFLRRQMGPEDAARMIIRCLRDVVDGNDEISTGDGFNRWRESIATIRAIHGDEAADQRIKETKGA